ncbi:hypothetical protein DID88_008921 [Monilinia fructigena]|uniref:Cytochrome b5 heme-binding domain-containing protein n=1 Tax=Monilinia fructigena TaxID=38457 RepID=A0A395J6V7_9HELO|nr:hypothetical protein DID88_008921 [Monilinia fructigena]
MVMAIGGNGLIWTKFKTRKEIGCTPDHLQALSRNTTKLPKARRRSIWQEVLPQRPVDIDDDFTLLLWSQFFISQWVVSKLTQMHKFSTKKVNHLKVYTLVVNSQEGNLGSASRLGQISLHIDPSQPGKISVEWDSQPSGTGDKVGQQSQTSAGPVLKNGADSSDPGKLASQQNHPSSRSPEKEFTMDEVAKHNKKEDLWVVVKGVVMDVSDWLDEHPGGPQALMNFMVEMQQRNLRCCMMMRSFPVCC